MNLVKMNRYKKIIFFFILFCAYIKVVDITKETQEKLKLK